MDLTARWREAEDDFLCSLVATRLCGTSYVIDAAENVFQIMETVFKAATAEPNDEAAYQDSLAIYNRSQKAFLEAARHDLAYNPKWWQFLRRRKEHKYREPMAQKAAKASPSVRSRERP